MPINPDVKALLELSKPTDVKAIDPFEAQVDAVYRLIDTSPHSDRTKERLLDALECFRSAWRINIRAWNLSHWNTDSVQAHLRGEANGFKTHGAMSRARARFERLASQLAHPVVRSGGYTAGELMAQAEIKKSSWQKVLTNSGISRTHRGNSDRRFTFEEIRRLAHSAKHVLTRKGDYAFKQWHDLIERNNAA